MSLPGTLPPLERYTHQEEEHDESINTFFSRAAHPDQVREADEALRRKTLSAKGGCIDPRYIYFATLIIMLIVVGKTRCLPTDANFTCAMQHYLSKTVATQVERIEKALIFTMETVEWFVLLFVDPPPGFSGCDCSPTPPLEGVPLPWDHEDKLVKEFYRVTPEQMEDVTLRGEVSRLARYVASQTTKKITCLYEFKHPFAKTPSVCLLRRDEPGVGAKAIAMFNPEIKGFEVSHAMVPESTLLCNGATQSRARRRAVEVSYTTYSHRLGGLPVVMRVVLDDEQEAFEFQMHHDVMNGKYVCD